MNRPNAVQLAALLAIVANGGQHNLASWRRPTKAKLRREDWVTYDGLFGLSPAGEAVLPPVQGPVPPPAQPAGEGPGTMYVNVASINRKLERAGKAIRITAEDVRAAGMNVMDTPQAALLDQLRNPPTGAALAAAQAASAARLPGELARLRGGHGDIGIAPPPARQVWKHGTRLGREHTSVREHLTEDHGIPVAAVERMSDGAVHGLHDGVHDRTWAYALDMLHPRSPRVRGAGNDGEGRYITPTQDTAARLALGPSHMTARERERARFLFGKTLIGLAVARVMIDSEPGGPPDCGLVHDEAVTVCGCGWRHPDAAMRTAAILEA